MCSWSHYVLTCSSFSLNNITYPYYQLLLCSKEQTYKTKRRRTQKNMRLVGTWHPLCARIYPLLVGGGGREGPTHFWVPNSKMLSLTTTQKFSLPSPSITHQHHLIQSYSSILPPWISWFALPFLVGYHHPTHSLGMGPTLTSSLLTHSLPSISSNIPFFFFLLIHIPFL